MRTAEEMYDYCLQNDYGRGMTRRWALKHFKIIEDNLNYDEEVYMTFIGLKDFTGVTKHDNNYAYALTNKRIMYGQKKLWGEDFKSIVYDKITDISSAKGLVFGLVTIDSLGEKFNVGVDKITADNISKAAHKIIFSLENREKRRYLDLRIDPVEEIRKYKVLMDEGIITEEEFTSKKKKLLKI